MNSDMFPEELNDGLQQEVEKLREEVRILRKDCKSLTQIYKKVWDITASVCCDGEIVMSTEDHLFEEVYRAMQEYDEDQDLRDKY